MDTLYLCCTVQLLFAVLFAKGKSKLKIEQYQKLLFFSSEKSQQKN